MAFASAITKRANFVQGDNGALKLKTSGSVFVDAFTNLNIAVMECKGAVTPEFKRLIGYISSFSYLNEFYNQLSQQLETSEILRIGDIIKNAKDEHPKNVSQAEQDLLNCIEHTYQLFGDPALPIMISKQDNNIFEEPTKITIGEQ